MPKVERWKRTRIEQSNRIRSRYLSLFRLHRQPWLANNFARRFRFWIIILIDERNIYLISNATASRRNVPRRIWSNQSGSKRELLQICLQTSLSEISDIIFNLRCRKCSTLKLNSCWSLPRRITSRYPLTLSKLNCPLQFSVLSNSRVTHGLTAK